MQDREQALTRKQKWTRLSQTQVQTSASVQALIYKKGCNDLAYTHTQALTRLQPQDHVQTQTLQNQFMLLGISALCFILILLLLLRRNQIDLSLTYQLIIFLPEQYIVDLEDLYQQIKSEESSIWVIRKILLKNVLEVLWAFHVQINLENLWLPKNKAREKIDD